MKNTHIFKLFVLCCAFLAAPLANATSELETTALAPDSTKEVNQTINEDAIVKKVLEQLPKISGYIQTGYNWGDKNGDNRSSFQMKRMRLILDKKISNMFEARAQFEVFSGSTTGKYNKKVMTVMDAFVNAHITKEIHFRAGQYYLPLGFENYDLSPASLEAVDFSNINLRMVCRNPVSSPDLIDYGRDIGIMMYGDLFENKDKNFNHLSYNLSVTNGTLPTLNDNNKSKDVVGRLTVRPIEKLRIMGSYSWGESQGLEYLGAGLQPVNKDYLALHRVVAGAWYFDPNGLTLRSEFGYMRSSKANIKEQGLYVLAGYKVDQFLPTVRWEMYRDQAYKTSANNKDNILVACAYSPIKNIKFQLNYTHTIYTSKVKNEPLSGKDGGGNSIQAMLVAHF